MFIKISRLFPGHFAMENAPFYFCPFIKKPNIIIVVSWRCYRIMSPTTFISNVGGLLGLFFGFSGTDINQSINSTKVLYVFSSLIARISENYTLQGLQLLLPKVFIYLEKIQSERYKCLSLIDWILFYSHIHGRTPLLLYHCAADLHNITFLQMNECTDY